MDFDILDVDDRDKFPPKRVWIYWDSMGEYMDSTCDPKEAARWIEGCGGHVCLYDLTSLVAVPGPIDEEYVRRMFPFPRPA